ncbi:MAG: carboxypeptidase-like regulatory domain-containing protein, partial [Bacteroidales bacterium]|nr:carboxypeptidase-like regulatory domain-containing protein [Bacteroidales bacterium]
MLFHSPKQFSLWLLTLLAAFLCSLGAALAQGRDVKGTVLDENDQGIAGAYVLVKGETRGAMTDNNGRFTLNVKSTDILVVSFLGYADEEVKVGDQRDLTVKLTPVENTLQEVVKVAYGTQRKASVIGSISSISAEQLQVPVGQLSTGLAGKLAGVVAVQHTGEPGSSAEFWIRGVNTFGANA